MTSGVSGEEETDDDDEIEEDEYEGIGLSKTDERKLGWLVKYEVCERRGLLV